MTSKGPLSIFTRRREIPLWRDERVLQAIAQIISAFAVIALIIWIIVNFFVAARARGLNLGFGFLQEAAGFPISDPILPFDPSRSFGYAFLVGIVKTLLVAGIGVVLATVLGVIVGLARLSTNWLLNKIALAYIEIHRNIPLLVLLFLWYFPVFNSLPPVKDSIVWPGPTYLSERGLYLTWPRLEPGAGILVISIVLAIVLASIAFFLLRRRRVLTGQQTYHVAISLAILLILPTVGWFLSGDTPIRMDTPVLEGFNFKGGMRLTPEFAALLVGLVTYTAAFIAEVVRAGIQSVHVGQVEAAKSIGLNNFQVTSLVIFPQALRVIIPPLISQYLNLTKNSSLALLIGYQDLFGVAKIAINQAGRAVQVFFMVMATYLTMSLITSMILNIYNRRIQLVER
jgi:general L-amino acid transport system permease protein